MHASGVTLEGLRRAARPTTDEGDDASPVLRNADAGSSLDQWRLREFVKALVTAYGYRDEFRGKSPPWRVPFIPMPVAGQMVDYFQKRADYWLKKDVPTEAKQPNLIKNWTTRATEILGKVERGNVVTPNPDSWEDAPPAVAAKAPNMFRSDLPAGQPHAKVLKPEAAWRFLDALVRLAIHYDALSGEPTKIEIFVEAVKEQAAEVGDTLLDFASNVTDLPGQLASAGKTALKWAAIAAAGLGALYVVTR